MSSQGFGCRAKLAPEGWPEEQTKPVKAFDSDIGGEREFKDEAAPPPIFSFSLLMKRIHSVACCGCSARQAEHPFLAEQSAVVSGCALYSGG